MRRDWTLAAACRDTNRPDYWYDEADKARQVCVTACPVRDTCLQAALAFEGDAPVSMRHGVWGGLGPYQRRALYRQLTADTGTPHTTAAA